MKNRYKKGLKKIYSLARAAERLHMALAEEEKDFECASVNFAVAKTYEIVVGWVIDEIRDADAEVRNGGEDND